MGLIFSNWDNRDESQPFELDYGQHVSSSCESSQSKILNFTINTGDSNEPGPKPAEYIPFWAYSDEQEMNAMLVKGLDHQTLYVDTDSATSVVLGDNNRSWIHTFEAGATEPTPYIHDYVASTFSVEVDLSNVECTCATGIYLIDTSMPGCDSNPTDGNDPQCSRVELMEANKYGFTTALDYCDSSGCHSDA